MRKKHHFNLHKMVLYVSIFLVLFFVAFLLANYFSPTEKSALFFSEVEEINNRKMNFEDTKNYLRSLAIKKGANYAFEVLSRATLPTGIDVHLLGHAIGDQLYIQKGADGMQECTEDYRNACSHSIVINLFYDKGEAALEEIKESCKKAPGGNAAYRMCYHGLGHGVLAYYNYDLEPAIKTCEKTGNPQNKSEYRECIGGAVMEQIGGGDHDKDTWALKRVKYLNKNDPLSICMGPTINNDEGRKVCLVYLTPYLWEISGRNSLLPPDDVLIKGFQYCENIPVSKPEFRDSCFGGFGKEFTGLAKGKDVRNIDKLSDEEMQKIYKWCLLAISEDGKKSCILYSLGTIFWSGAVDKKVAEHFCELGPTEKIKDYCFRGLINSVSQGQYNKNYKEEFCGEIPTYLNQECRKILTL